MWDYSYLREMSKGINYIITYGTREAEITGEVAESDPFISVKFTKGFNGTIQTSLVGAYNLPNILAAVAAGSFFKIPDIKIKTAIEQYLPTNSRSQLLQKDTDKIILDAYNANPSSMKAAIENFARAPGNKKILVLGAMAELGPDSIKEHQAILDEIKKYKWQDVILVGGDFMKMDHPFQRFNSSEQAGIWLKQHKSDNRFLLIKGSRSMKMEKVLEYL
jgi:UDP-N-acetylmuramoyl-tripeptide--D-alanyl-D-alanine ligase